MSSVKLTAQFVLIALLAATNVLSVPTPINPKSANSHKFWERTTNFDENYAFVKRHSPGSSDYTPSNQENTDQLPEATPTPTVTSPTSQNNSDYTPLNEGSQSPEEGYPPTATSPTSEEDCNDTRTDDYSGQPPEENAPDNTIQSPTEQSPSTPQNEGTDEQPSGDTLKGNSDYTPSNQENTDQLPEATPTPTVTSPTSQNNSDYTPSNEGSQSPEEGYPPTATSPTSKEDCNDAHTDDYSGQPPAENAPDNTIQSPTEQSPSIPQNEGTDEQPSGDTLKGNSDYTPSLQENTDQPPEETSTPTAASPTSKEDCNDTLPDDYSDEGKLPREDTPSNGGPSSTGEGKSNYAASTQ